MKPKPISERAWAVVMWPRTAGPFVAVDPPDGRYLVYTTRKAAERACATETEPAVVRLVRVVQAAGERKKARRAK